MPGAHRVPRAGHPRGRRAQDEGRPGEAGQGASRPLPRRTPPSRSRTDEETGQTDHLGHGRAAPRGHRRPHAARVQRRRHRRPSRRWPTARRSPSRSTRSTTATSSRPVAPASSPSSHQPGAHGPRRAATSSSTRSHGGRDPEGVHPGGRRRASRRRSTSACSAGYPTVDVRAKLVDGQYTTWTPRRWPSRSPARMAFKEAARKAKPVLLEPIMAVEVVTPEDYMGDVDRRPRPAAGAASSGMEERRQQPGHPGAGAPVRDVRLPYRPAFAHPEAARPTRCEFHSLPARSRTPSPESQIIKRVGE